MAPSVWKAVSTIAVLISLAETASALMCYQCNSSRKYDCQEMWDYEVDRLTSTNCELYEAKYCIKAVGIWGGIAGTSRFCSAKDLGNQCQYIRYPDHDRLYQACVYTCTRDDCNHAHRHAPWLVAPLLLLTNIALYILR